MSSRTVERARRTRSRAVACLSSMPIPEIPRETVDGCVLCEPLRRAGGGGSFGWGRAVLVLDLDTRYE